MESKLLVSLVCPFYNEETCVIAFYEAMMHEIEKLNSYDFEVICIDDGSNDRTLEYLIGLANKEPRFTVLEFSRNFGKEAALTAGLDMAR